MKSKEFRWSQTFLSNGAVENAIKRLQGQTCTIKMSRDHVLHETADMTHNIWHWSVEHAIVTFKRYKIGENGVTPHKRVQGREANIPIAAFGENGHITLADKHQQNRARCCQDDMRVCIWASCG